MKTNHIQSVSNISTNDSTSCIKKHKTKKYKILTAKQKSEIIDVAKKCGIIYAMNIFGIHKKNIENWLKKGIKRKEGSGRPVRNSNKDKELRDWCFKEIELHKFVDSRKLRETAKKLFGIPGFNASNGWLEKFQRRYGINVGAKRKRNNKIINSELNNEHYK